VGGVEAQLAAHERERSGRAHQVTQPIEGILKRVIRGVAFGVQPQHLGLAVTLRKD
jgi:hypothetical protein